MRADQAQSSVKGMYFVAARQYLLEQESPEVLARVVAAMPAAHQVVLLDPLASEWYPEAALHDAFVAVWAEVCRRDEKRFLAMLEACTLLGMHRFFRVLLGITTPSFLLKRYPTLFKQLRRGPAYAEVEVHDGRAQLRIADLEFADDRLYQLAFLAGLNVLFDAMKAPRPRLSVGSVTPQSFAIDVAWRPARA